MPLSSTGFLTDDINTKIIMKLNKWFVIYSLFMARPAFDKTQDVTNVKIYGNTSKTYTSWCPNRFSKAILKGSRI